MRTKSKKIGILVNFSKSLANSKLKNWQSLIQISELFLIIKK